MWNRMGNLRRIQQLDPQRDFLEIYQTMVRCEWPYDMKLGLNLAFNRGFAIPHVSRMLAATGELTERTQQRIDDTGLLMYEILLHGFDHPRGRAALRRINQMHHGHAISNEDYLYALAALIVVPIRWLDRYGWRRPCCHERAATHAYYRELGRRMGIREIPDTYAEVEAFFDDYDRRHLRYSPEGQRIERATRMLLLTRIPTVLAPVGDSLVSAMFDSPMRRATGAPQPSWLVRVGLHVGLKTRAKLLRWLARPRREPLFADGITTKTYPDGYDIEQLGPRPTVVDDAK